MVHHFLEMKKRHSARDERAFVIRLDRFLLKLSNCDKDLLKLNYVGHLLKLLKSYRHLQSLDNTSDLQLC